MCFLILDRFAQLERLVCMIRDASTTLIMSDTRSAAPLDEVEHISLDCLLETNVTLAGPRHPVTRDSLAYVIYTSRSTGVPKGILGLHRSLANPGSLSWSLPLLDDDILLCKGTVGLRPFYFQYAVVDVWRPTCADE